MKLLSTLSLPLALCSIAGAQANSNTPVIRPFSNTDLLSQSVSYDDPGGGQLWARGKTYKASFGTNGATYIPFLGSDAPHNMPVRFTLSSASVSGEAIALEPEATWSRNGDTVMLDRGDVDVHYLMKNDSMEQTFVFDSMPAGGDLEVRVKVESELELQGASEGFRWVGQIGGVRYGSATVIDADGRRLDLASRLDEGDISIRVPEAFLREASYPLVVDPLITTFTLSPPNVITRNGDVCFDASSQNYFQVSTQIFSQSDWDVYGSVIGLDGVPRPQLGAWVDLTADKWGAPSCANSNEADNCLVVASTTKNGKSEIWGRIRNMPSTSQGFQFQISQPASGHYSNPSVGGDPNDDTFNRYFVAYTHKVGNNDYQVLGQALQSSGTLIGGVTALDTTPGFFNRMVHVSKSCGTGAVSERRFNVVWAHEDGDNWIVRGAQMNSYGFLKTPLFTVDSTAGTFISPHASPPVDSPDGATRDFLVVYGAQADGDSYIRARLFKDNVFQATFDINELEAVQVGNAHLARAQSWPAIGTDGSQFVVAYAEQHEDGTTDIISTTLRHYATTLVATESHVVIADTLDDDNVLPNLATQHDAGAWDSRDVVLDYRNQGLGVTETAMGAIYEVPDGWGSLRQTFCSGMTNSTGEAASFRAYGSADATDNRLVLDVNGLPNFSFGQFIMSTTTQNFPLDNGTLCLGQPLMRLGSTLGSSWLKGSVGFELDLTSLPGNIQVLPGQTWHFQYWYRDAGSSNFSNAESVTFQ